MHTARTLPATPESVRQARDLVTVALLDVPCTPPTIEVARLLVSELATHAVTTSQAPTFTVEVAVEDHTARVVVQDADPGGTPGAAGSHPTAESGFWLLERLASRWWWDEHTDWPGKTIGFELPCHEGLLPPLA